jgi:hypothetical protein
MKNLKSIIAAAALLVSLNSVANNNTSGAKEIQSQIQSQLNISTTNSQKVEVVFTTNESGDVNLAIAKTENKELKQSIETSFAKLHLNNTKANTAYSIIVNLQSK